MSHVLHVITNGKQEKEVVAETWKEIANCADYLHIREKRRTAREIWEWGTALQQVSLSPEQLIVNDRLDVGVALNSGGVQLAYHSLPARIAKSFLPSHMLIGCSVHHLEQAKRAEAEGADYLLFGHVFDSQSKPGLAARGLNQLHEIVESVSIPVIAIGGMTPDRVSYVLETGCTGIAVMSAIMEAPSPKEAAQSFMQAMKKGKVPPKVPWRKKK